ncbi:MAG: hypothetical protein PVJ73_07600 [Acidobacteriota bacterium]|jgi:hypothetical protein
MKAREIVLLVLMVFGAGLASAQETSTETAPARPSGRVVEVVVQGPTGSVAPEPGAPPPVETALEPKPARGVINPPERPRPAAREATTSLRALSFAEDEATVDTGRGTRVLRPGSRMGEDVVTSISPGRLVLLRPEVVNGERREGIVIVTFDTHGEAKTRVFWVHDPSAPSSPEVPEP